MTFSRFYTVDAIRRFVTSLQLHRVKTPGLFKITFCKKSPCLEALRLFLLGGIFFTSRWLWTHPSSSSLYLLWKLFWFLTDLAECLTVLKCYWCDNLWTTYWQKAEEQLISHQFRGRKSLCTHSNLIFELIYDGSKWFRISLWREMQIRGKNIQGLLRGKDKWQRLTWGKWKKIYCERKETISCSSDMVKCKKKIQTSMWNHQKNQKLFQMHLEVHLPTHFKALDKINTRQLLKLLMKILGTSPSNKSQNNALPFLTLDIFPTLLTSQTQAVNRPMRNVLAIWSISYTELFWVCFCRNLVGSFRKKPWKEIIFMHCQWSEKQSLGAKIQQDNTAN